MLTAPPLPPPLPPKCNFYPKTFSFFKKNFSVFFRFWPRCLCLSVNFMLSFVAVVVENSQNEFSNIFLFLFYLLSTQQSVVQQCFCCFWWHLLGIHRHYACHKRCYAQRSLLLALALALTLCYNYCYSFVGNSGSQQAAKNLQTPKMS